MTDRIPVTVLTGYLGAGKTTLLNRILSNDRGRRYAVIVNDFGEIGIDSDLIVRTDEELFEMNNGCICCSVRGDLIRTLHGLLERRSPRASETFDAIIVETTGLADPGPIAQTFLVDPMLQARTRLDSITTVVDAHHIGLRLADSREAAEQIAFADQIILNKIELVNAAQADAIEDRLRALSPLAPIYRTTNADVDLDAVLGRGGFDLDRIASLIPAVSLSGAPVHDNAPVHDGAHVHDAQCGHDHAAAKMHATDIVSVSLTSDRPLDRGKVEAWLTALFLSQGQNILRAKGVIDVAGEQRRLVFQAVHMLLDGDLQRAWLPAETRCSRLVFIGRHLDAAALDAQFQACRGG